jgi:hypothetical protein
MDLHFNYARISQAAVIGIEGEVLPLSSVD